MLRHMRALHFVKISVTLRGLPPTTIAWFPTGGGEARNLRGCIAAIASCGSFSTRAATIWRQSTSLYLPFTVITLGTRSQRGDNGGFCESTYSRCAIYRVYRAAICAMYCQYDDNVITRRLYMSHVCVAMCIERVRRFTALSLIDRITRRLHWPSCLAGERFIVESSVDHFRESDHMRQWGSDRDSFRPFKTDVRVLSSFTGKVLYAINECFIYIY